MVNFMQFILVCHLDGYVWFYLSATNQSALYYYLVRPVWVSQY